MIAVQSNNPWGLWRDFSAAIGSEVAARAYGADRRFPLKDEQVWEFREPYGGWRIGWGSLVPARFARSHEISIGVLPRFQRQGFRRQMVGWLSHEAFSDKTITHVTSCVLLSNTEHLARLLAQASAGGPWHVAGFTVAPPPGQVTFLLTRERFEAQRD